MNPYQNYGYQPNYQQPNYMQRGYAPQPSQMPQIQQQTFAPIQPPPPTETPIQDIKFVNRAQAEAYIVFPNAKVMLIDTENGMAYIKTADNMGQTKTDYFRFEPINADGSPIKSQEPTPQVDFSEFVKVDEFKALQAKFDQLIKRLEVKQNGGQPKQATEPRVQV